MEDLEDNQDFDEDTLPGVSPIDSGENYSYVESNKYFWK